MLKEIIGNRIAVKGNEKTWEDAIKTVLKPMVDDGMVEVRYIDSVIKNVIENGSYIVILPGLAIPHSRPEDGAIETGISILKLDEPVMFPEGKEVSLMFALSAKDSDTHIDMISELTEVFMDDDVMEKLFNAESVTEIEEILC